MGKDWCIGVCVRDFMKCVLIVVHWALCATLGRHPVYDYCINNVTVLHTTYIKSTVCNTFKEQSVK